MIPNFQRGILISIFLLILSLLSFVFLAPTKQQVVVPKAGLKTFNVDKPGNISLIRDKKNLHFRNFESLGSEESSRHLASENKRPSKKFYIENTSKSLDKEFSSIGYFLDPVGDHKIEVPRVFVSALPEDFSKIHEVKMRKRLFFRTLLPLILQANEEILLDKSRMIELRNLLKAGKKIDPINRLWLLVLFDRYNVKRYDWKSLAYRVDIIPPSLALAQAAEESGWGSSRFVKLGNAIFGEWTNETLGGMIPLKRDRDKSHRVRAFRTLSDSVKAYVKNLNTHLAYRKMRAARFSLQKQGQRPGGLLLAKFLEKYSERGPAYVKTISSIIRVNKLSRLDSVRLAKEAISHSAI